MIFITEHLLINESKSISQNCKSKDVDGGLGALKGARPVRSEGKSRGVAKGLPIAI